VNRFIRSEPPHKPLTGFIFAHGLWLPSVLV
jgi:hypothetical protein